MQLTVNAEQLIVEDNLSISQFIEWYRNQGYLEQENFAIAVNMEFVPRSIYSETYLRDFDKVEIVLPMQGG
ncbi:MAG: sulfur carrier protein ThiS [Kangiellaceae bacterium]|nr:sulfur carrier protein ThiS [Kangiellaceae bacterium]